MKVKLNGEDVLNETSTLFDNVEDIHIEREGHPRMSLTEYKGKLTILFGGKVLYTEENTRVTREASR